MLVSSAAYIQKHLYDNSWETTLSKTDRTEIFIILVSLISLRALDKTHTFNTFIKKGIHLFETAGFSREHKNRFTLLKKLRRESCIPHTTRMIQAQIKEYNQAPHDALQVTKKHPTLFTARIFNKRVVNRLKRIAETWFKKALIKTSAIKALPQWDAKDKKDLAFDSLRTIIATIAAFPKPTDTKTNSIYVAIDANRKVHAIALVSLENPTSQTINYLITNPDDLEIFGTEKEVTRGAGSALIQHIAQNVLSSKKINKISLASTSSAISFYKKLGFKRRKRLMILEKTALKSLVKGAPPTHIPLQKEPSPYLRA